MKHTSTSEQQHDTVQQAHRVSINAGDRAEFPGSRSNYTERLEFVVPELYEGIPVYRVMNRKGQILNSDQDPNLDQETITRMYKG